MVVGGLVDQHGGKEFRPLTFCRHPGGAIRDWRWQTWSKPRPLFNLNGLHNRPSAPVIVAEGERSCLAAERPAASLQPQRSTQPAIGASDRGGRRTVLLGCGYVCVTSAGGSKAAAQADWGPLTGRDVVIWPDADSAGPSIRRQCVRPRSEWTRRCSSKTRDELPPSHLGPPHVTGAQLQSCSPDRGVLGAAGVDGTRRPAVLPTA
jgi:hypothetical protein